MCHRSEWIRKDTLLQGELLSQYSETLQSGIPTRLTSVHSYDVLLYCNRDLVYVGRFVQGLCCHPLLFTQPSLDHEQLMLLTSIKRVLALIAIVLETYHEERI